MKKLLWIGDAGVRTGFERATRYTLDVVREQFEVSVLGLNYFGDPNHGYPYDVYPAIAGGDAFGYGRLKRGFIPNIVEPDVILIQNDPWNFQSYLEHIPTHIPVIGLVAVDGKCCRGDELNGLSHAIFWTRFGELEAKKGGYAGSSSVVPLGVDRRVYYPQDRSEVRERLGLDEAFVKRGLSPNAFVVGYVGRNQPRKRLDLIIEYFAEWVHQYGVKDAALWLHVAPTGEDAYDVNLLRHYYDVEKQVVVPSIPFMTGVSEDRMRDIYAMFNVFMTTTQGEGFGLPVFEAMACGVPVLAPDWSGLGELVRDAATLIPCTSTAVTCPGGISTIGGIPDRRLMVEALNRLYESEAARNEAAMAGEQLTARLEFDWREIGLRVTEIVQEVLARPAPCQHVWKNVTTQRSTLRELLCPRCQARRQERFDEVPA